MLACVERQQIRSILEDSECEEDEVEVTHVHHDVDVVAEGVPVGCDAT